MFPVQAAELPASRDEFRDDIYRPNSGKLLLPGSRITWELYLHSVGEQIADHVELAVYFYPKGQEPKYRTTLTAFEAVEGAFELSALDIPPNSVAQTEALLGPEMALSL